MSTVKGRLTPNESGSESENVLWCLKFFLWFPLLVCFQIFFRFSVRFRSCERVLTGWEALCILPCMEQSYISVEAESPLGFWRSGWSPDRDTRFSGSLNIACGLNSHSKIKDGHSIWKMRKIRIKMKCIRAVVRHSTSRNCAMKSKYGCQKDIQHSLLKRKDKRNLNARKYRIPPKIILVYIVKGQNTTQVFPKIWQTKLTR